MSSINIKIGLAGFVIIILLGIIIWFSLGQFKKNQYVLPQDFDSRLAELKKNHPEFTTAEVDYYSSQAAEGNVQPCRGRMDQSNCVLSVAYLDNSYKFCGEIEDVQLKLECTNLLLPQVAKEQITACLSLDTPDFKIACLSGIFDYYQQPQDCVIFKDPEVRKVCEGTIYFKQAQLENNGKICDNISNSFIKVYCLQSLSVQ